MARKIAAYRRAPQEWLQIADKLDEHADADDTLSVKEQRTIRNLAEWVRGKAPGAIDNGVEHQEWQTDAVETAAMKAVGYEPDRMLQTANENPAAIRQPRPGQAEHYVEIVLNPETDEYTAIIDDKEICKITQTADKPDGWSVGWTTDHPEVNDPAPTRFELAKRIFIAEHGQENLTRDVYFRA